MSTRGKAPTWLRVAAAQMKPAGSIRANLEQIAAVIQTAARRRADAVLFPECATTGYTYDFPSLKPTEMREALCRVGRLAALHHINVLIGSPVNSRGRWRNCLVVFDRAGHEVHCYAKCQLTPRDRRFFSPGDAVALFPIDGVPATAIICHERRYPELVRLAVMAGARIIFHPNAGLDPLAVSKRKRGGRDGMAVRAFENAVFYVFANFVGAQGGGRWSAGDSKIVAPDGRVLRLADNRNASLLVAELDVREATGEFAHQGLEHPRFLSARWRAMVRAVKRRVGANKWLKPSRGQDN